MSSARSSETAGSGKSKDMTSDDQSRHQSTVRRSVQVGTCAGETDPWTSVLNRNKQFSRRHTEVNGTIGEGDFQARRTAPLPMEF